jgi:hypothetical protein
LTTRTRRQPEFLIKTTAKTPFFDSSAAWIPTIVFGAVCLWLVLGPALSSQFGPTDDHEIALMLGPDRHLPLLNVPEEVARHIIEGNGRFRPMYWIPRVIETAVWGWNPQAWYIDRLALAITTIAAGAWLANLFVPRSIAILTGLFVVIGPQAEAWFRLGPQEAYAVPLALAGLALVGRRHPLAGVMLLLTASLTKESFLPFAFVGVGWTWYLGYRRHATVAAIALFLLTATVALLWVSGGDYYAQLRSPEAIAGETAWMLYEPAVAFGWPLVLIAAVVLAPRSVRWPTLALLVAVIVVPQAVIYAGLGWSPWVGRYLLPAVLGSVAVAAVSIAALAHRHSLFGIAGMTLCGLLALQQSIALTPISNGWAVTGIAFQASLSQLRSAMAQRPSAVLIVRPLGVGDFEYVYALRRYVPEGTAMLEPPAQHPAGGVFEETLLSRLVEISTKGGEGYSPLKQTLDCIELDIRVPREHPLCPVAVIFY